MIFYTVWPILTDLLLKTYEPGAKKLNKRADAIEKFLKVASEYIVQQITSVVIVIVKIGPSN
jgi:hypothetical protein